MSEETKSDVAPQEGVQGAEQEELGGLMQSASEEASSKRLEDEAVAAAEQAIEEATSAVEEIEAAMTPAAAGAPLSVDAPAPATPPGKLWALRTILLVNFALMGIMIALPNGASPESASVPAGEHAGASDAHSADPPPFVMPYRDPRLVIPKDSLYDEALLSARDGNYEQAAEQMHGYIMAHPTMHPSLMQGAYVLLGRYLRLSGRVEEAVAFETRAQQMIGTAHLPEDLWRTARAAEERSDAAEMRRAYARLLLQQSMLTPTQRAVVAEAYLKFGDSYRMEAEHGEERKRDEESNRVRDAREDREDGR